MLVHVERPITPVDKTRELQRKLYLATKRSRNRRFHALYDRIFRPDVLWRAWEEVIRNGGSAGVDGVTIEDAGWNTSTGVEFASHDLESCKKKVVGEPDEGKPHVRFEVAGDENQRG